MGDEIVFKNRFELQNYVSEFLDEVYDKMDVDGLGSEDALNFLMGRLRNKVEEDFGSDVQPTA